MADSKFVKLISIPKSFYVSARLVGFKHAFKLPVMVRFNCALNSLKGRVIVKDTPLKRNLLSIGFSSTGIFDKRYSRSVLEISGNLVVKGMVSFGQGTKMSIGETGTMTVEDGFSSTAEGTFVCVNKLFLGKGTAVAWSAMIMDTDWHSTKNTLTNELSPAAGEVYIGRYCWIGTRSMVLKNSYIPDGCILAANSTANKRYPNPSTLLGGTPAIEKKHNIMKSDLGDIMF